MIISKSIILLPISGSAHIVGDECYPLEPDVAVVIVCETCGESFEVEHIGCIQDEEDPQDEDF